MSSSRRQLIIFLLTAFLGFSVIGGVLFTPKEAHAQWFVTDVGNAAINTAKWTWERLKDAFVIIKKNFADVAFKNALKTYLTTLAEDTATWVASAGTGQKPLFITDPQYFNKLNDAAVGDFLDSLSQPTGITVTKCEGGERDGQKCSSQSECGEEGVCVRKEEISSVFGRTLCDPGKVKLQLDLALRSSLTPNFCQDGCTQNYQSGLTQGTFTVATNPPFEDKLQAAKEDLAILQQAKAQGLPTPPSRVYCPGVTLDGCIQVYQEAINNFEQKLKDDQKLCLNLCSAGRRKAKCTFSQIQQRVGKTLSHVEVVGNLPKIFKPTENPIGQFLTLYQEAQQAAAKKEQQERDVVLGKLGDIGSVRSKITGETLTPGDLARAQAAQSLAKDPSGSVFSIRTGSPIADAIGVFTNTLTKKLIDRIYRCGLNPALCREGGGGTKLSSGSGGLLTGGGYNSTGVASARASFASSFTPDLTANTQIDTLTDLQTKNLIDAGFRDAIGAGLTVGEATKTSPPKLDSNKPFGFSRPAGVNDLTRSVEPDANSGYPYRSMLYLRKNRIIPVGWEIAAEYIGRYKTEHYTLGKVLSCYNDNVTDDCKPFYRLVDPNWVLKVPATQCARKGFGEEIVPGSCHPETLPVTFLGPQDPKADVQATVQVCQREEICVDDQTCVIETPDGKGCREYGYCTAEKPIWRFNGTACSSQYNGCQSYQSATGETVSYVKDTLRTDTCSAGNVGCQRYFRNGYCSAGNLGATCTSDADCGTGGVCSSAYDPATSSWKSTAQYSLDSNYDKIFLDKDAQTCSAQNEGCTKFLRTTGGANLAKNPSFEEHTVVDVPGGRENFPGWAIGGANQTCGVQAFPESGALFGATAARFQSIADCNPGPPPGDSIHYVYQVIDTGTPLMDRTFTYSYSARTTSGACTASSQFDASAPGNGYYSNGIGLNLTTDWQRFSETYTFGTAPHAGVPPPGGNGFALLLRVSAGCDMVLDGVQVEESPTSSSFRDYGSGNDIHLKQAPAYLGCTGNLVADRPECSNFALKCAQSEVGCDLFTSTSGSGEAVPGKVTNPLSDVCINSNFQDPRCNQCPAQFVGCQAFQEVKLTGNPPDPTNPVRTGFRCSNDHTRSCAGAGDPSCGAGNSCLPILSFIPTSGQRCSAAEVGCEEYTNLDVVAKGGEGKEYYKQLRACVNNQDPQVQNYYSWEGSDRSGFQLKLHKLKQSNLPTGGPCTNLDVSPNAVANANCVDTALTRATCTYDPQGDPDCVRFYDTGGATYDLSLSRTIVASDSCIPYRNTLDTNVYYFDGQLSRTCSAAAAGCREYKGNAGNNIRVVINDTFEDNTNAGWQGGQPSNQAVNFGGHSLEVTGAAIAKDVSVTAGKTYLVSFWAMGSGALTVSMNTVPPTTFSAVAINGTWNRYSLGPVTAGTPGATTQLAISGFTGQSFLDNISLTEVANSVYLIRNSYSFCQGYENCSAYRQRDGNVQFLKSFSKICQAEKVGCEALIDTHNSSSAFEQKFDKNPQPGDLNDDGFINEKDLTQLQNAVFLGQDVPEPKWVADINSDGLLTATDFTTLQNYVFLGTPLPPGPPDKSITIPADRITYLVNDPAKSCAASEKGCGRFGLPKLDAQGNITSRDTVFLKDNPDDYSSILCQGTQVSCSAYTLTDTQGQAFFKDPGQRVCEFRENVGAARESGYYKVGSDDKCPAYLWPHLCPADQSSCSLYQAPTAYPTPAGGETNFYNLASTVPAGECPQGLDPTIGCYAFHTDRENNRINTIRPNVNPTDNTVISQSCQVCSPEANTCGRNGGTPCCTWDDSTCSIKQSDGADSTSPYYCLYEDGNGQTGCQTTGGKVMPNDDTNPTNCSFVGGGGLPTCFRADRSDYDATQRACSDFACTANIILKVKRDRICGEWLACTNQQVVTNDQGKQTTVCLERQLCRAEPGGSGTCTFLGDTEFPHSLPPANLTVASPADVNKIANLSGYVKAGIDLATPPTPDVNGLIPQDQMSEEGLAGTEIDVPNPDFEAVKITGLAAFVPESDGNFEWKSYPWDYVKSEAAAGAATIKLEKFTPQDAFTQQFLRVTSRSTQENGTFVWINRDEFSGGAAEYFVTFDARTVGTPSKELIVSLRQNQGAANSVPLWGSTKVTVTDTWQRYVVRLPKSANSLKLTGAGNSDFVELAILHTASNVPSESFLLDSVSLKPVLKVQDNPTFVARQCRSYSKDSAPECTFTDTQSGVNFAGWKGYCVERDPADPTKCITWLPIDTIAGEKNFFGPADRSLTRSPLFYCAESKKKDLPFLLDVSNSRWVCLNDDGAKGGVVDGRCSTIAQVAKPKAAAYSLTTADWQLGTNTFDATGNLNKTIGECLPVTNFGGKWCTDTYDNCADSLAKYWDLVGIWQFRDDGGSTDDCSNDNTGDGNNDCNDGNGGECSYSRWDTLNGGGYSGVVRDWVGLRSGTDQNAPFYDPQGAAWQNDEPFPRQCTTLVQVTRVDGTSRPWTARVTGGFNSLHPISYVTDTQCSPYGGAPVIQTPNDIFNCVAVTTDQASPVVCDPACTKLSGIGTCTKQPLELYSKYNPDNNNVSKICVETRLGNGLYSCEGGGICRVCTAGNNLGLNCTADSDCGAGGVCSWQKLCTGGSRDGAACNSVADCPGGAACGARTPSNETLGTSADAAPNVCVGGSSDGHVCASNANCPGGTCTPQKVSGISRLKQLFVQSYGVWQWDSSQQKYISAAGNLDWSAPQTKCGACASNTCSGGARNGLACNVPADCPGGTCSPTYGKFCTSNADCTAPQTCTQNARPGTGFSGDAFRALDTYCYVPPTVSNVKVSAGDKVYPLPTPPPVILSGNSRTITLQFSAKANPEQEPIRNISIDWGDGQNRSGYTGTSANKTYFCASTDGRNCSSCLGGGIPQPVSVNGPKGCQYQPEVIAKDNWGKSSGACSGGANNGSECFLDSDCNSGVCQGVPFGGSIFILP